MEKETKKYYLGLDIGTDSVGYAATNSVYELMKFHGEPVWGTTTFEAASLAEDRRIHRTQRRRFDRRQQRVQLLSEIFAPSIGAVDANFFIRRKESALFEEDTQHGVKIFDGGITDKEYHILYPTIHHLIVELMNSTEPHDVRLVYLACAWLVANRGHFLLNGAADEVRDFSVPYNDFREYLAQDCDCALPWDENISADQIQSIMQTEAGVTRKKTQFTEKVFGGKKPSNKPDDVFPFRRDCIVTLLSGGKVSPKELFCNDDYADIDSVSLAMDEENFERILAELGDAGMLLHNMRKMYDCALLNITLKGYASISEAKVEVYKRHAEDLKWLKYFVRKYKQGEYDRIFRDAADGNYTAYSYNLKNCPNSDKLKKAKKDSFCEFLTKIVKNIQVDEVDQAKYDDMLTRLEKCTFLPKQKDTDNRVIPQQLYRYELAEILRHAREYLPMLNERDEDGLTNEQKILSVFDFRIPYFVGPLNPKSDNAWLERKVGKIYPWNFEQMVDLDESEQRFIRRMTNTCTYLSGEDVLPSCSLLYSRFTVLNELNNLKLNGHSIPVAVKQEIYTELFEKINSKITKKKIEGFLKSRGFIHETDELTGIDTTMNANLKSYHCFKRMLDAHILSEEQVEDIINHAAYSEDKKRMSRWLAVNFPTLSDADRKYIINLKLKGFGRLSRKLLREIMGCEARGSGEAFSVMDALWETNDNLMQLFSERYTFIEQINAFTQEYYADPNHRKTLSERLSDMYVSNAVKRQIIRSLDVTADVVKAMGCAPEKIFIEMARGGTADQKGKRTVSRKQQILDLYKKVKNEDVPLLTKELENMGNLAENSLQSDRLFLYYMQLGKCMYTGERIELTQLSSKLYDIDHIYPQSKVKDDSILNNKVLVLSSANGIKSDRYPIDEPIRTKMTGFWEMLRKNDLITEEKYHRLTRNTGFTEDELHQFINRQLVETRQTTKVAAQLLKERYPKAEIVYVKAGMVSEFRQEFEMLKCRSVNDLHHAKDAYLNIVVGNVYHEKFTKRWFDTRQEYNVSVKKTFENFQKPFGNLVWRGKEDIDKVKNVMRKNNIHVTQYPYCRHHGQNGGFFDQNPVKARDGLIPCKAGMETAKYGGYNGSTGTFFTLAEFTSGKKRELMFFPVDLLYSKQFLVDDEYAKAYITETLKTANKAVSSVAFPLGKRILKINTVLSLDGFRVCLASGSVKDGRVGFLPLTQFVCSGDDERYIKRLEQVEKKSKEKSGYVFDAQHDGISAERNFEIFDMYIHKLDNTVYAKRPGTSANIIKEKRDYFIALPLEAQCRALIKIQMIFTRQPNDIDLSALGLSSHMFKARKSMYLSGWKKDYSDVRIVDMSSSGLFEARSKNLLELI